MKNKSLKILKKFWGFDQFKGSQEFIINAVLHQNDVLALLPTAGGKSVCFQVPALQMDGICIVVSPLVALIQDQVQQLRERGIKAIALTGSIKTDELIRQLDNCIYGKYKFLYISPERLQSNMVRERIGQMPVSLIAIDEAHCISQWGHDFRPAYLQCSVLRDIHPSAMIIALTATATPAVIEDIKSHLELNDPLVFKDSFVRNNISFGVVFDENKLIRLFDLCSSLEKRAIVYVRTRRMTAEICRYLQKKGISASAFHGGMSANEKEDILEAWLQNKIRVMVATNAFGMGVDKPDVELVVHLQIPDCIENYYQEAGRAGRDGAPSRALLLINPSDKQQSKEQYLDNLPDINFLKRLYKKLNSYFSISYGEGANNTYRLNFNHFCEQYGFSNNMCYQGLSTLDRYSVLNLSQSFKRRSQVQFIVGKNELMAYLSKNPGSVPIVQNILRTYGGIFDFMTPINTVLVAKKSGLKESSVLQVLNHLEKDRITKYEAGHSDLEITFLVPREDDRTIHAFASELKELFRVKEEKFRAMIEYIENKTRCRTLQLLSYFGESTKIACGHCDVCLGQKKVSAGTYRELEKDILKLLGSQGQTSRQLINNLPYREKDILEMLQHLLEDDLIEINARNEYQKLS